MSLSDETAGLGTPALHATGRADESAQRGTPSMGEGLELTLEGSGSGIWDWDLASGTIRRSPRASAIVGRVEDEATAELERWEESIHPDDRARVSSTLESHLRGDSPFYETRHRLRHGDDRWVWVRVRGMVVERGADGSPLRMVGTVEDVSERQARDEHLRLLQAAVENLNDIVLISRPPEEPSEFGTIVFANRAFERHLGHSREGVLGRTLATILDREHHGRILEGIGARLLRGEALRLMVDVADTQGRTVWLEAESQPLSDEAGRILHFVTVARPVNERMEAEDEQRRLVQELEKQQARLSTILQQLPVGVILAEAPSGRVVLWNQALESMVHGAEMAVGSTEEYGEWEAYLPDGAPMGPEDWPLARALAGEIVRGMEFWSPDPSSSGEAQWWRVNASPIRDRQGNVTSAVVTTEDITEARRTEGALRRSQEQLRHAQKMDAIGRLAGGMAHDFNNLLTAILGYGEFLQEQLPPGSPELGDVHEIVHAAIRGRALTHQLLAFGRKSSWNAQTVLLNDVVESSRRLLHRVVGESVLFETALDPASGSVKVDANHLEQVLVNLVLNARDALDESGGTITVRTAPLTCHRPLAREPEAIPAGEWETVTVGDEGAGIPPEVRALIFEPFFTTKESGRGTGLGLALVYGIVKQAGGYVSVESTPDIGTEVTVYLPRAAGPVQHAHGLPRAAAEVPGASGVILLVEDQAQVRTLLTRRLERAGYRVIEARHGRDALLRYDDVHGEVDLVLTDVVMPEMGGRDLADELQRRAPDLPILFMSGYTGGDVRGQHARPQIAEEDLLVKPFGADELLERVGARVRSS
jgi:PAS domain S-box-containing protein